MVLSIQPLDRKIKWKTVCGESLWMKAGNFHTPLTCLHPVTWLYLTPWFSHLHSTPGWVTKSDCELRRRGSRWGWVISLYCKWHHVIAHAAEASVHLSPHAKLQVPRTEQSWTLFVLVAVAPTLAWTECSFCSRGCGLPDSQSPAEQPSDVRTGCLCSNIAKTCLDFSPFLQIASLWRQGGTGTTCQLWARVAYFHNSHRVFM